MARIFHRFSSFHCPVNTAISSKHLLRTLEDVRRGFFDLLGTGELDFLRPDLHRPEHISTVLDDRVAEFQLQFHLETGDLNAFDAASGHRILHVFPYATPRVVQVCKSRDTSFIDLNGRAFIRAPGLLVEKPALPHLRFRYSKEPATIFVGKSERIVRTLLTYGDHVWSTGEIASHTDVSPALVSRVIKHLERQLLLARVDSRKFSLHSPRHLLEYWTREYDLSKRVTTYRFAPLGGRGVLDIAHDLQRTVRAPALDQRDLAFTQWIAGWARQPHTEPVVVSAYVRRPFGATDLQALGLREVADGGKVWLYVPHDDGVFRDTQEANGLTLVADPQIYVDLKNTGLRGPEQGEAILDLLTRLPIRQISI